MTLLDKVTESSNKPNTKNNEHEDNHQKKQDNGFADSESSAILNTVESQFQKMMSEFNAIGGFSVDTGEQAVDTMIELLSGKEVAVSIAVLLSYIRYCVNHGIKKDITLKIGYNKPPAIPMNFAINEELLGDIYPGDVVEIN